MSESFIQVSNELTVSLDMAQIVQAYFPSIHSFKDPHPWLHGDLTSYTRIMRGEDELPHIPDGRCLECRAIFDKQFDLVRQTASLSFLSEIGRLNYSTVDFVTRGLARLREGNNDDI